MADASGLLALGKALDDYLVGEYSPPPGAQTALGFVAGVPVNPATFQNDGVFNPALVNLFLNAMVNKVAPVTDGRFMGGLVAADQLFALLLATAAPVAPGTPAAQAFGSAKDLAGSTFGVATAPHNVVATPANWYDPANRDGWRSYTSAASSSDGNAHESSSGETPPIIDPTRPFERMWQWRTLDPANMAAVAAPPALALAAPSPDVGRPQVVVRDHRAPRKDRIIASAPRLALGNRVDATPLLASRERPALKAQAMVELVNQEAPELVAEIRGDGETVSSQSVESDNLTLSLEYSFVDISRSAWWNDLLLRMPTWCIPGLTAGGLVPGASLTAQSMGLPIAMVLTRNVQITGHWSEADRTAAASHTSLGPWHVGDTDLSSAQADASATLSIPGIQLIAVVCSLLPSLPPSSDPALPAASQTATA